MLVPTLPTSTMVPGSIDKVPQCMTPPQAPWLARARESALERDLTHLTKYCPARRDKIVSSAATSTAEYIFGIFANVTQPRTRPNFLSTAALMSRL